MPRKSEKKKIEERKYIQLWNAIRKDKRAWLSVSDDGVIILGMSNSDKTITISLSHSDIYFLAYVLEKLKHQLDELFKGKLDAFITEYKEVEL